MIITEGDNKAGLEASSRIPSLVPRQTLHTQTFISPPPAYEAVPSVSSPEGARAPLLTRTEDPRPISQRVQRRFLSALLIGSLIWIIAGTLFGTFLGLIKHDFRLIWSKWGDPAEPEIQDGLKLGETACQADVYEVFSDYQNGYRQLTMGRHPQGPESSFSTSDPFPSISIPLSACSFPANGEGRLGSEYRWCPYSHGVPGHLEKRSPGPDWDHLPPYYLRARYVLHWPPESLYLVTRGHHAHGLVEVQSSESVNEVIFEVSALSWNADALSTVNMCLLARDERSKGFGIFTPRKQWRWLPADRRMLSFHVKVLLPIDTSSPIKRFDTTLPNFGHMLRNLSHSELDAVTIFGSNSRVFAESLRAHDISVHTTNDRIYGRFFTDGSLSLKTSNAPIHAEINLLNEPVNTQATRLSAYTTNGFIDTSMVLHSIGANSSSWPKEAVFDLDVATTNAEVNTRIAEVPAQSLISLKVSTTNAAISAAVYRAFEGVFKMLTTNAAPSIAKFDLGPREDPSGLGRVPQLECSGRNGYAEGSWYWGLRKGPPESSITLETRDAPIRLRFI